MLWPEEMTRMWGMVEKRGRMRASWRRRFLDLVGTEIAYYVHAGDRAVVQHRVARHPLGAGEPAGEVDAHLVVGAVGHRHAPEAGPELGDRVPKGRFSVEGVFDIPDRHVHRQYRFDQHHPYYGCGSKREWSTHVLNRSQALWKWEFVPKNSAEAREVVAAASALRTVAERCQAAVEAPNLALRDHITLPDASDDSR